MNNRETRLKQSSGIELRKSATGAPVVAGRGISFDVLSQDLGGFKERFTGRNLTLDSDFRLLFNHDTATPLASVQSGTLRLNKCSDGLYYQAELPDTSYARDLTELIRTGIANQVSFGFCCDPDGDVWSHSDDGVIRTVNDATIFEISILGGSAAYEQNTVDIRSALKKLETLLNGKHPKRGTRGRDNDDSDLCTDDECKCACHDNDNDDETRSLLIDILHRRMSS